MTSQTDAVSIKLEDENWRELTPVDNGAERQAADSDQTEVVITPQPGEQVIDVAQATAITLADPSLLDAAFTLSDGVLVMTLPAPADASAEAATIRLTGMSEAPEGVLLTLPNGEVVLANEFLSLVGREVTAIEPEAGSQEDHGGGANFTPYSQAAELTGLEPLGANADAQIDLTGSQANTEDGVSELAGVAASANRFAAIPNYAPIANTDFETVSEGASTTINPLANDRDPNQDQTLRVLEIDASAIVGEVTLHADGTVTYDTAGRFESLAVGQSVTEEIRYLVADDGGEASWGTMVITVQGTNDGPQANDDIRVTDEDVPFVVDQSDLTANDQDIDGDTLTITSVQNAQNGTVSLASDGTVTFTPSANYHGPASFEYTISDGHGGTDTGLVSLTINSVNDAPIPNAVSGATSESGPAITLRAEFGDVESEDNHTFSFDATGTRGSVTNLFDTRYVYDPNGQFEWLAQGETATDSFTYIVTDNQGGVGTATATVTITGENDAPIAQNVSGTVLENGTTVIRSAFQDVDISDTHTFALDTTGTRGTVTNNMDGTYTYDPGLSFNSLAVGETATDTFTYTVTDEHGASDTKTVTVTIIGENDAPNARPVSGATGEDGPAITLTADFGDLDFSDTHIFSFDATGTRGSVTNLFDTRYVYDPNGQFEWLAAGQTTTDTFTYTVTDEHGASDTKTMTVTITGANDAPMLAVGNATAHEDGTAIEIDLLALASDPDSDDDANSLTYRLTGTVSEGSVSLNGTTLTFDPGNDFQDLGVGETREITIPVQAIDRHGAVSGDDVVKVTVMGTNDAPIAMPDTQVAYKNVPLNLTKFLLANDIDIDGDVLSFFDFGAIENGSIIQNPDGTVYLMPNQDFTGEIMLPYAITDGHGGFDVSYAQIDVRPITLEELTIETTSVVVDLIDGSAEVLPDGSILVNLAAELSALASAHLSLLGDTYLQAELSGGFNASAHISLSPEGVPQVVDDFTGFLNLAVVPGPFFQPMDADPNTPVATESLEELFLQALAASDGFDLGELPPLPIDLGGADGPVAVLQAGASAQAVFTEHDNLFLRIDGAIDGYVGMPLQGPNNPILMTEIFGEFSAGTLVDMTGELEAVADGFIDGGIDAEIIEQAPADAPAAPSAADLLAGLVPDDLPVAA